MCPKWLKHETKQSFSNPLEKKTSHQEVFCLELNLQLQTVPLVCHLNVNDEHKLPALAGNTETYFLLHRN